MAIKISSVFATGKKYIFLRHNLGQENQCHFLTLIFDPKEDSEVNYCKSQIDRTHLEIYDLLSKYQRAVFISTKKPPQTPTLQHPKINIPSQ